MNISGAVGGVGFLEASVLGGNNVYCVHLTDDKHMPMRIICWYLQTHCSMHSLLPIAAQPHAQQASAGGRHCEPGTQCWATLPGTSTVPCWCPTTPMLPCLAYLFSRWYPSIALRSGVGREVKSDPTVISPFRWKN